MATVFPSVPVVGEVILLNAGDVQSALSYWAEDSTVKLPGVPSRIRDSYSGKAQVRAWLESLGAQHSEIRIKVIKVRGNIVTTRPETSSDLTRQLALSALITTETYVVSEGKIACLTLTISPKSRLIFQSDGRAQQERGGCGSFQE